MGYCLRNFFSRSWASNLCQAYTLHNPMTHSRIRSGHTAVGSLEYPVLFIIDPLYENNKATRAFNFLLFHITPSSLMPHANIHHFPSTYPPDPRLPRSGQLTTSTGRFVESVYKVGRIFFVGSFQTIIYRFFLFRVFPYNKS